MDVRLVNVSKSFGDKIVIHPTDYYFPDKTFTTLLGPSGCGKTTLLRLIAGLEVPDTGEIYLGEKLVFSADKKLNLPPEDRNLAFVFQDFALWPHMTIYQNLDFVLQTRKYTGNHKERILEALEKVQLQDRVADYPSQLSGGQKQRVAFARAIVSGSKCILFDEPLSALDAVLREQMRHELTALTRSLETTAIFVTHDQEEAMSMSDTVAVIGHGRIVQSASPEELYKNPSEQFVARFIGKANWLDNEQMFRPEDARISTIIENDSFTGDKDEEHFDVKVLSWQFLGTTYELQAKYGDKIWTLLHDTKIQPGTELSVFINKNQVKKI